MPVYLFTFHAYRSWMPDRSRGYVRRGRGILPRDDGMAEQYKRNAKHDEVEFDRVTQEALVRELQAACEHQKLRLHAVTTETSHIHPLVSWRDSRGWMKVRIGLKSSLSRRLSELARAAAEKNGDPNSHLAFSRGASRKRVEDEEHLNHLMTRYLPKHSGAHWFDPAHVPLAKRERHRR